MADNYTNDLDNILSNDFAAVSTLQKLENDNFIWALSYLADVPYFTKSVITTYLDIIVKTSRFLLGLECLL